MECVVADNNALAVPMPPPPIAGSNTGEAVNEANQTIDKKLKEMGESIDKATQCSFGRTCSSDYVDNESQPNVGKNLTNEEKAQYSGVGSGSPSGWEPQDEENARTQQSDSKNFDDKFKKSDLVSSANKPINNQGLSAGARAWEKHAGRPGGIFEPLKGNVTQKNEAASRFINEVLNNKNTVRTDLSKGGIEYRLPDGRGVRYNSDGSFSGFLDPKR